MRSGATRAILVLITLIAAAGCASRTDESKGRQKTEDEILDDAARDARKSQHQLNRPNWMTGAKERYRAQVKLAGVHARERSSMLPDAEEYARIIATRPDDSGAKIAFARTLVTAADRDGHLFRDPEAGHRGAAWMSEVVRKHPDDGENFLLRARCLQISGDASAAAVDQDLTQAEKLSPDDPDVHLARAREAIDAKNYAAANEHLQAVLHVLPEQPQAHYLSGVLSRAKKDAAGAAASNALALKYQPDLVDALADSALDDYAAGRLDGLTEKAAHVARLYPAHPVVNFSRAVQQLRAGERSAALHDLQIASPADPQNEVYARLLHEVQEQSRPNAEPPASRPTAATGRTS